MQTRNLPQLCSKRIMRPGKKDTKATMSTKFHLFSKNTATFLPNVGSDTMTNCRSSSRSSVNIQNITTNSSGRMSFLRPEKVEFLWKKFEVSEQFWTVTGQNDDTEKAQKNDKRCQVQNECYDWSFVEFCQPPEQIQVIRVSRRGYGVLAVK